MIYLILKLLVVIINTIYNIKYEYRWFDRKQDLLKEIPELHNIIPENHKEYTDMIPDMNKFNKDLQKDIDNNKLLDINNVVFKFH